MKTTNKQFNLFKSTFTSYQKMLGLKPGYEIYFTHEDIKDCYADISVDQDSKKVSVRFAKEWGEESAKPLTNVEIEKTALHECLHLFFSRLTWIARSRYIGEEEVSEENHTLVITLVEVFRDLEGKK